MKKALQSILPGAKDSAAAKLRRNNPPVAVPAGDGLRPITADITDSEDDGGGSSGGETPPPPRTPAKRTGGGGGGGSAQDAVRAESFESLMEEYRRFERKATAGAGGHGGGGGDKGRGRLGERRRGASRTGAVAESRRRR